MSNQLNTKYHDNGVVINGIKWATRNVDKFATFAETPESSGEFYQWNTKIPCGLSKISNYSESENIVDNWEEINDPSPQGWRLPTTLEFAKLLDKEKVQKEWTSQNNVNGVKFTDLENDNSIFLPAVGISFSDGRTVTPTITTISMDEVNEKTTSKLPSYGTEGKYWCGNKPCYFLGFNKYVATIRQRNSGAYGQSIRCVAK